MIQFLIIRDYCGYLNITRRKGLYDYYRLLFHAVLKNRNIPRFVLSKCLSPERYHSEDIILRKNITFLFLLLPGAALRGNRARYVAKRSKVTSFSLVHSKKRKPPRTRTARVPRQCRSGMSKPAERFFGRFTALGKSEAAGEFLRRMILPGGKTHPRCEAEFDGIRTTRSKRIHRIAPRRADFLRNRLIVYSPTLIAPPHATTARDVRSN